MKSHFPANFTMNYIVPITKKDIGALIYFPHCLKYHASKSSVAINKTPQTANTSIDLLRLCTGELTGRRSKDSRMCGGLKN